MDSKENQCLTYEIKPGKISLSLIQYQKMPKQAKTSAVNTENWKIINKVINGKLNI